MSTSMVKSPRGLRGREHLIVRYLEKARDNIFSTDNTPVSVRIIAQDVNLSQDAVYRLCQSLAARDMLQEIDAGGPYPFYRMP